MLSVARASAISPACRDIKSLGVFLKSQLRFSFANQTWGDILTVLLTAIANTTKVANPIFAHSLDPIWFFDHQGFPD